MTLGEPKPGDAASLIRALTDKNVELFAIMPGEGNPTHVGSNVIALPLALDGGEAVNEAILVLNAGSSSIKFAAFGGREPDRSAGPPVSSGDDVSGLKTHFHDYYDCPVNGRSATINQTRGNF